MQKWSVIGSAGILLLVGLMSPVFAHFAHYEIDVRSSLVEDAAGNLTAIHMNWLYDQGVSELLLEDEDLSPGERAATLQAIAGRIMSDLYKLGYYTHLKVAGKELQLATVTNYKLDVTPDKRLQLDFMLPLAKPQPLAGTQLDIEVVEPTGSGVLLYKSAEDVSTAPTKANCLIRLEAHPNYAHGGPAQTAHLQCQ